MATQTVHVEGSQLIGQCDVDWKARVRLSYREAKLYGPPENCHEAEADWDIEILETYPGGLEERIDEGRVLELAWEKFDSEAAAADKADYADYIRDSMRDR